MRCTSLRLQVPARTALRTERRPLAMIKNSRSGWMLLGPRRTFLTAVSVKQQEYLMMYISE